MLPFLSTSGGRVLLMVFICVGRCGGEAGMGWVWDGYGYGYGYTGKLQRSIEVTD